MVSDYLIDIEQHLIGLLLHSPETWPEVNMIAAKDFSLVRRPIINVIRQQLDVIPQGSVTPVILAEKLKSYGTNDVGGVDTLVYLEGLARRGRLIEPKEAVNLLKELKTATVRRELIEACDEAKRAVQSGKTLDEMVGAVDKTLSGVSTSYFTSGTTFDVFESLEANVEARGSQEKEDLGYVGVLPSVDRTLGPLIHKGSFTNISARSGNGKSSFGFFYSVGTAELHNLPILWLDAGEMTPEQLQFRAVCAFSKGRIPLWAVRSNGWRKNKEWVDIMRGEVFPRAKRLVGRFHYKNVGGMSVKEKTAFMRRHYYNKVGRGNFLIIVDDYLKGMESLNKETKEYQSIGYYTSDVKSLVTSEIDAGFMTFTQSNRFGITKGKKENEIQDNDSVVSLSDRIKDNCTSNFILRYKVMQELAREKHAFGNVLLKNLKIREGLGKDYEFFARPIKTAAGYAEDYFNLDYHGFHYTDKGLFSDVLKMLGHVAVDLSQREGDEKLP